MGILENSGLKSDSARLRKSLYLRWYAMMDRCYNVDHPSYSHYGASGIVVDPSWHTFEAFLADVVNLPGFDQELILNGGIHLDKDSLFLGNKVYSKATCCFISIADNNKHNPFRMFAFIGTAPDGTEHEGYNQCEFARTHGLRQSTISDCLSERVVKHRGWRFRYKE